MVKCLKVLFVKGNLREKNRESRQITQRISQHVIHWPKASSKISVEIMFVKNTHRGHPHNKLKTTVNTNSSVSSH